MRQILFLGFFLHLCGGAGLPVARQQKREETLFLLESSSQSEKTCF